MIQRENAYFEGLSQIAESYENAKRAHEEKKQKIIETCGWDSDEMKAWYEVKGKMSYPIPQGTCKAFRAFKETVRKGADEIIMDDFLWDKEVADFTCALRKAGFESFIYTNQSTAVMQNLHDLEAEGCKMQGLCKITQTERRFGKDQQIEIPGIRFSL